MTAIKKILPYILTSIFVIGYWGVYTCTDNYAWNPKGKDILMLEIALSSIFFYKSLFWLVVAILSVFIIKQLFHKNFKTPIIAGTITTVFYFIIGNFVDKKCAFHYYIVFHNQSVTEEYMLDPIIKAGYQIGPILTENIANKEMKYRRYAIGGLEKLKYKPATPTLAKILLDKSEIDVLRADAYVALTIFDTDEANKTLTIFKNQSSDSIHKKVIELGESFLNNK